MRIDYSKLGELIQNCITDSYQRDQSEIHDVLTWAQIWGDSSLGFGGLGLQAFHNAQTVVVVRTQGFYIYHGGRFAYKVSIPSDEFIVDLAHHKLLGKMKVGERYEAK